MKIVTAAEMREIDRVTTDQFNVPSLTLMEKAGTAVARFVMTKFPRIRQVTIVCGKGNNGGDGFVAARKLGDMSMRVNLILLGDPTELKGDAAVNFAKLNVDPLIVQRVEDLHSEAAQREFKSDVIIDAILGTGFRPPVTGLYAEAIWVINNLRAPVVSVDIPSGADADTRSKQTGLQCRSDAVITFTAPKPAHVFGELSKSDTVVVPIGSPDAAVASTLGLDVISPREIASFTAFRDSHGHKGKYGHVLVVGGSTGKAGAAAMAGISVLKAGAGLSTVATPISVMSTVAGYAPELMTEPLAETGHGTIAFTGLSDHSFESVCKDKDVLAIGPGLSRQSDTAKFVQSVVESAKLPVVLDADGLNAFEGISNRLSGRDRFLVLTPHPGEMARLTGLSTQEIEQNRIDIARAFAKEHSCVLVLKGHRTVVALADGTVWINVTGNPGMSSGGSGDVLTGILAGLLGQATHRNESGVKEKAVLAAVYLHGLAGDVARERVGEHSLVASDIIAGMPEAFKRVREQAVSPNFVFHS